MEYLNYYDLPNGLHSKPTAKCQIYQSQFNIGLKIAETAFEKKIITTSYDDVNFMFIGPSSTDLRDQTIYDVKQFLRYVLGMKAKEVEKKAAACVSNSSSLEKRGKGFLGNPFHF